MVIENHGKKTYNHSKFKSYASVVPSKVNKNNNYPATMIKLIKIFVPILLLGLLQRSEPRQQPGGWHGAAQRLLEQTEQAWKPKEEAQAKKLRLAKAYLGPKVFLAKAFSCARIALGLA